MVASLCPSLADRAGASVRAMKQPKLWMILAGLVGGLACSSNSGSGPAGVDGSGGSSTGGRGGRGGSSANGAGGTGGSAKSDGGGVAEDGPASNASDAGSSADVGSSGGAVGSGSGGTGGSTDALPPPSANGFVPSAACTTKVAGLVAQMTLDQKIGQMLMIERQKATPAQVAQYFLGGTLTAADAHPEPNTPTGWADEVDRYHQAALGSALKIPLFYAIDAVHGNAEVPGAVVFPHNIGIGATHNSALAEKVGQTVALEMGGVGLDFTFAPMIAVSRDDRWGRENESFGESPDLVGPIAAAFIRGLQGPTIGAGPVPIIGCAKHFVADGATKYGSMSTASKGGVDRADAIIDEATLKTLHLKPYGMVVPAGVGSVMATVSSLNGVPGHSNKMLTDVLKGTLGFKGFVISDYDGIDETTPGATDADKFATGINAGIDMFMLSGGSRAIAAQVALLKGLVPGKVTQARIDDAVSRILLTKCMMGMFEASGKVDRAVTAAVGSAEHRAVARQAVRESLVLLKNDGKVLPLAKTVARVHLGGKSADAMENQCGGWTIDWQGKEGKAAVGTTVRKAIGDVITPAKVTYVAAGTGGAGADVGIAVIGETPYAEWEGDKADLGIDAADVAAVKAMKDAGLKTVVILISGRPMILDKILPLADAIVAAWLPGTEAGGIADVLFGDAKPTGKLPQSWPKSMSQIPINVGDASYDPLYPFGYGLTY
jgi:beta-glucosidase